MSRTTRLVFGSLALLLVLFPLTVGKPGLPMNLKSDEPAYYLMALSLAKDFDLKCELKDIRRLATEFPYDQVNNLILESSDGWKTVYFGKPYLISLVAAPATALFGADGFVAINMALLLASVWMGARYLRQFNPEGLALLFSAGFFLASNSFAYVFWMHTEVLCIFGVTASLYLAFTEAPTGAPTSRFGRLAREVWNETTRPMASGAALVLAAYNKPILALLGVAALWRVFRGLRLRGALTWIGGAAAATLVVCGISVALTGHPSAYLGVERSGVRILDFDKMPVFPVQASNEYVSSGLARQIGPRNSWGWIFSSFELDRRFPVQVLYFLVGRHTGLFLYAPLTLVALVFFLLHGRRAGDRWLLLATLGGIAFCFLTFIPFNWHGGGGFIGNRYFVNALPGFLFLVTRLAPSWLVPAGYALAGIFVGPILFTPYGTPVPEPTLQAHVRNKPFRFFPFEETIGSQIPGYRGLTGDGIWFFGRRDIFLPAGDAMWVGGGAPVEIRVRSDQPLRQPVFQVTTVTAPNSVELRLDGAKARLIFTGDEPPGSTTRVVLSPAAPAIEGPAFGGPYYPYTLWVRADRQAVRTEYVATRPLTDEEAAARAERKARGEVVPPRPELEEVSGLVGAEIVYLGDESELAADVYHLAWLQGAVPPLLRSDRLVQLKGAVRNTSGAVWHALGATRVAIAYHWLSSSGERLAPEGLRSPLPGDVAPGASVDVRVSIATPKEPGRYVLEIDALRERIAWFSDRTPGSAVRFPVEIVAIPAARDGGATR